MLLNIWRQIDYLFILSFILVLCWINYFMIIDEFIFTKVYVFLAVYRVWIDICVGIIDVEPYLNLSTKSLQF